MAFIIHSTDDGRIPGIEYLPCSAIAPKIGLALIQTDGKLAIAAGENKPTYISMCQKQDGCTDGELIPVIRVQPDMIFETSWSEAAASVKLGDKVTLSTDGEQATATTTNGVAEVIGSDGTATGDTVRVRFA